MRQLKTIIVFILFFPFLSISQEKEYVVLNNNDTIYGEVIRAINYLDTSKIIFILKGKKGKKRIKPSEVSTIRSIKGVDGDCYITTINDKLFAKKIVDGRIKVYQLIEGVIFYVSKDNSDIIATDIGWPFSQKKAHSQIRPLIKDNPEILKELDSLNGSARNMIHIIEKYNAYEK